MRPRGPRARPYTSSSGVAVLPSLTGSSRWQGSKAGSKATMMVVDGFPEPEGGAYEDPCHPDRAVQGLPDRAKPTGQLNPTRKPASPFLFSPSPPHTLSSLAFLTHTGHGRGFRVHGSLGAAAGGVAGPAGIGLARSVLGLGLSGGRPGCLSPFISFSTARARRSVFAVSSTDPCLSCWVCWCPHAAPSESGHFSECAHASAQQSLSASAQPHLNFSSRSLF